MANRLQFRRGTAAQAVIDDPTLASGEIGVETDTKKVKMGDGTTAWTSLDYLALEINWLGELTTAPTSPSRNDAYRDLTLLESRIWDGSAWDTLVIDGVPGGPVPVGGTAGQIIEKNSATDFDVVWTDGFGVGDIIMHDGVWTDNVTKVGWYACIAANSGQGCPDLENSFIKGSAPADVGDTGGSNTHTLIEAEMPSHTHVQDSHIHTQASHLHNIGTSGWGGIYGAAVGYGYGNFKGGLAGGESSTPRSCSYTTVDRAGHALIQSATPVINGTVATNQDAGSDTAHNNEPAYYKLIYIRKCS